VPPSRSGRTEALAQSLRDVLGDARLTVRPWRGGTDFYADLVGGRSGPMVLRSPRHEHLSTTYEGLVDFGEVLEKESVALALMAGAGIPVPTVLSTHRAGARGGSSWILLNHVQHDENATPPFGELGSLTRRLHSITPDRATLRPVPSWSGCLSERLRQRVRAARAYCDLPAEDDVADAALPLLVTRDGRADRLLHMDLRPANVCVRDGVVAAIIDAANCVVGDPLLELGRIRGYGLLNQAFLAGYGISEADLSKTERRLLDVYELDTAALLTVVAVEEVNDPELHQAQAARASRLAWRIIDRR
jgi:aminoglycoside phosphotransferase (APT) family kinase protein